MAGIFKSLDASDRRITPFQTHKFWSDTFPSSSIFTLYKANYVPSSTQLEPTLDPHTTTQPTTSNGQYQSVVHTSVDHLYYRNFYTNNKASFGGGNITKQFRYFEDQAQIISVPQSKFGESILPGSVNLLVSWSCAVNSGSLYTTSSTTVVSGSWTISDDKFGNLTISGSGFYSPYGQYIGGAFTNYTSSISKIAVGEWPFDELYKYVQFPTINLTSSYYNRGDWSAQTIYSNLTAYNITSSATSPYPSDKDFLGAVLNFSSQQSSSIKIGSNAELDYLTRYNFENADFAITMMVMPTAQPTNPSGSILITKQGPIEDLQIDINGNVYSQTITNRSPFRIVYTSGSNLIKFEKDNGGTSLFSVSSSVSMSLNNLYQVAAVKSGSVVTLYVNGSDTNSITSGSINFDEKESSNKTAIYIGNLYNGTRGFDGVIDNVKIYKEALTQNEINILYHTMGVGNTHIGNVFYNNGMIVMGSIPARFTTMSYGECRGTHTIWETEISCTVSPGEFGMSSNRSLEVYDSTIGGYKYAPFVTSSYFKPYITTIGLYDDYNRLLAVAKLSTPIQTPNNVDTTFIVKYDI
jgi:hypothetical protein